MSNSPHPMLNVPRHASESISVIDSHTCGQPTRVVVHGANLPAGIAPVEAVKMLSSERDWVRRMAVFEPRGHRSMFAVALIEPAAPDGVFGLVYMDANGYPDMCGHATIGAVTTLYEAGYLRPQQPDFTGVQPLSVDVPMGRIDLSVTFENGRCTAVAFRTPLAYYLGQQTITLPDGRMASVDLAYGGQWYAFLPAEICNETIAPDRIDAMIAAAAAVRDALSSQLALVDPVSGLVPKVGNIVWTGPAETGLADARNVPISSAGSFDRSPCGTATCARMATLAAKGLLAVGEPFRNQGLVGTVYRGSLSAAPNVDLPDAFVPQVEGSAWLTGTAQFWRDPRDPLGEGFLV